MAVDLSPLDESLLAEIANIHGMPKGAFNIRKDGQLVERHSSANIEIATKTDESKANGDGATSGDGSENAPAAEDDEEGNVEDNAGRNAVQPTA